MRSTDAAGEAFREIARELKDMEDAPDGFAELVELAVNEEAGIEDLETAAELMSPSDLRVVRAFCARVRDGYAGDAVLIEGLDSLDAIFAETDNEWEA